MTPTRGRLLTIVALVLVAAALLGLWLATRARPPAGVTVVAPDAGGAEYYRRFTNGPDYSASFPLGLWLASARTPEEIDQDQQGGINTYVGLSGDSKPDVVVSKGMTLFQTGDAKGAEGNGWVVSDEVDMWAGAGTARWTGRHSGEGTICDPPKAKCGFTAQQRMADALPDDGRMRFANYGKGLLFWAPQDEAARFANQYQDVVSVDAYWYTDRAICQAVEGGRLLDRANPRALDPPDCHRAANYGKSVEWVRELIEPRGSKPVWMFIELGRPSGAGSSAITPEQMRAAVWQSIIHGARGIIYFNHSFSGPCQSTHLLRDACWSGMRHAVTELNQQIGRLSRVLNAPDVRGLVATDTGVDVLAKIVDDDVYVLAAGRRFRWRQDPMRR